MWLLQIYELPNKRFLNICYFKFLNFYTLVAFLLLKGI